MSIATGQTSEYDQDEENDEIEGKSEEDLKKYFLSIAEFLGLGWEGVESSPKQIENALKLADADSFVDEFPRKYQSKLGRIFGSGVQLSGGQWQKLVIARAFFRDTPLWVFDEPTSSIDALAESKIFENIKAQSKEKVTIIITHRLYNLKFANKILVMDQGRIVEQGTFDELKANSILFNQLYEQQKV